MKILTWKEVIELEGTVVYKPLEQFDSGEVPYIKYPDTNAVIEEPFPITEPEMGCDTFFEDMDKFKEVKLGKVSDCETTRDVFNCYNDDTLIVVYETEDLISWMEKISEVIKDTKVINNE